MVSFHARLLTQALLKAESELRAAETVADLAAAAAGDEEARGPCSTSGSEGANQAGTGAPASAHRPRSAGLGGWQANEARAAAAAVRDREVAGARAQAAALAAQEAEREEEDERQRAQDDERVAAALDGSAVARQRLRGALRRAAGGAAGAAAGVRGEEVSRRGAVLALKGSLEGVRREVAAKADLFQWVSPAGWLGLHCPLWRVSAIGGMRIASTQRQASTATEHWQ